MVLMTLWDNEKNELVCRETKKESEIIPTIKKIFSYYESKKVRYLWGFDGEKYAIDGEHYTLVIKFASKKQLNKFTEFMTEICDGEIEKIYCR